MSYDTSPALVQTGKQFLSAAGGRWAAERMLEAMNRRQPLNASVLRNMGTLRKDEWIAFDTEMVEEASIRLQGVADLISAGLTTTIPNALGKTMIEWELASDMTPAITSLDGVSRSDLDTIEFDLDGVPLPITHKDFNVNLRRLQASREGGEALDTTKARMSGRLVSERLEYMLFRGGPTYGGRTIYGYTTHPNRLTGGFGTNGNWSQAAKTGENRLADVQTMANALRNNRHPGPYWLYLPTNYANGLDNDFKASSDISTRERIAKVEGLSKISFVDSLPADNMVMVQASSDVVKWAMGDTLQTVQWDLYGGFEVAFKAYAIQVPILRIGWNNRSGIYHMS